MFEPRLLSLRRLVSPLWVVIFAAAVVLLLVSGALSVWQYWRFAEASASVEHTYQVLAAIDDLTSRVAEAETAHRGFLLTRDPRFLQPYTNVDTDVELIAGRIETLVSDNPSQTRLARRLHALVLEKLSEMANVLVLFNGNREADALAMMAGGHGRELMDDIRTMGADMEAAESEMLAARGSQVQLARRSAFGYGVLSVVLAVGLGMLGYAVNRSFGRRRADLEREMAARALAEAEAAAALSSQHASDALAQGVLDSSGDSIALLDLDGRVMTVNGTGLRLMEIPSLDTVSGCPWPDLWGTSGVLANGAVTEAASGQQSRFQGSCLTSQGPRWFDVIVAPLRGHDGRVTRLVGTARDITDQKRHEAQLRESEQQFRTLADSMPQIAWSTRADGYFDYFNERWYEYTGMPRPHEPGGEQDPSGTGQGWHWRDFLHRDDVEVTLRTWTQALESGDPYHVQYRLKRVDGQFRWFIARAVPLHDANGAITRWFGTSTDIDDQKRAEEERAQLLASERSARSEAERAARMKDEFVSTLSHELRTPLNAIVGWIGVLKQDSSPEALTRGLSVIDRNLKRQSQMIDDLLDISRIISGKLRLDVHRVDLAAVIEEAVASVQPAADAKNVRLITVLGSAAVIQGDPGRLQQVVWNLLTNAVKFTPKGGLVQVTLRKQGSHVHIEVSDNGEGISAEFLPQIFQRFRQADASSTRRHGGLGLGLAIVKNLVEMHGGSVDARSEGEGSGAIFTVRLPLALARQPEAPEIEMHGSEPLREPFGMLLEGLMVLVVDDEPDARELVQRFLSEAGAGTTSASSASEALELLEQGLQPDIIVSDIGMPERDGYDFMRRVRQLDGPVASAPAAALTALARGEDRKRALLAGYQTHLAKPVDPTELVAMVASLAGRTGRFAGAY
ncbi:MAG: CHASE3 domain-containing protein [Acidobacteria bacterium]|nr:CHASE3 domain-containing protein [Acidobacteriota bacterium]